MPQLLFYERPVPLSPERHADLRLATRPDHHRFAAGVHAIPVTGTEMPDAARDHPLAFQTQDDGSWSVVALVGLRPAENLWVDAQGCWQPGTYVPAFVRRYPFVLANAAPGEPLTVCMDEACAGLDPVEGEPLFDTTGQPSEFLLARLDFLQRFHGEAQRTQAFLQRLRSLELLVPLTVSVNLGTGEQAPPALPHLWQVNPARYREIPDEAVVALFRLGELSWIEAHLASLGQVTRLVERLATRLASAKDPGRS
jgi:hypothetical protein